MGDRCFWAGMLALCWLLMPACGSRSGNDGGEPIAEGTPYAPAPSVVREASSCGAGSGGPQDGSPQRMAEAVAALEGVRTVHVLQAEGRVYVALILSGQSVLQAEADGGSLPAGIRDAVRDRIRSATPGVKEIYVTGGASPQYGDNRRADTGSVGIVANLLRDLTAPISLTLPDRSVNNRPPVRPRFE